jgi:hypothetical protein
MAPESVDHLGPDSTGRWLVRSRGSEHLFDLDAGTYRRTPGPGRGRFPNDGHTVRLASVERWPRVGGTFLIWIDDREHPDVLEHWHQSSVVQSITRFGEHATKS